MHYVQDCPRRPRPQDTRGCLTASGTQATSRSTGPEHLADARWKHRQHGARRIQPLEVATSPQRAATLGLKESAEQGGAYIGETATSVTHREQSSAGCKRRRGRKHAVAKALTVARGAITIITDNKGVWNNLRRLQGGQQVTSEHQADWDQARRRIHRLQVGGALGQGPL